LACTDPATRSPGSLFITYLDLNSTEVHSISWHFLAPVVISNLTALRAEANRLHPYITAMQTNVFQCVDWGIRTPTGHVFHQEPLLTAAPGTHSVASGMQNWRSTTVAFVGRGTAAGAGGCTGRSISRLYIGGALNFRPGDRNKDAAGDAPFGDFVALGLNASTFLPADFYGQSALISDTMPCQWNASTQKRYGS